MVCLRVLIDVVVCTGFRFLFDLGVSMLFCGLLFVYLFWVIWFGWVSRFGRVWGL